MATACMDIYGKESTADVTIQVTARELQGNLCSPDTQLREGAVRAYVGAKPAAALPQPTVPNPSSASSQVTPFVPACRLPQFSSTLTNVTAKASPGSKVELKFSFKGVRRCWPQSATAGSSSSSSRVETAPTMLSGH